MKSKLILVCDYCGCESFKLLHGESVTTAVCASCGHEEVIKQAGTAWITSK